MHLISPLYREGRYYAVGLIISWGTLGALRPVSNFSLKEDRSQSCKVSSAEAEAPRHLPCSEAKRHRRKYSSSQNSNSRNTKRRD
jgi:hypothetical protein